jgi:pyrroloquinoline quinone biosynthesis protein B
MKLVILGSGQDGGIPHIGCRCAVCSRARKEAEYRRLGPSIAVFDPDSQVGYIIDASPDFRLQVDRLTDVMGCAPERGEIPVSTILLTHGHAGHYIGLWQLGKEALNVKGLPVYCTGSMERILLRSSPFDLLISGGGIRLHGIVPGTTFPLTGLKILPIAVPHRSETTDAVGYIIEAEKRVAYIPDTDGWTEDLVETIATCDVALLDGTFYSKDELPRYASVPHPPIVETVEALKGLKTTVYFTHINHTNPVNTEGPERSHVEDAGSKIAHDGLVLDV